MNLILFQKTIRAHQVRIQTTIKQAIDAKKEIEKLLGRKLAQKEHNKFHDHVTGQGYGYHEMVEEGDWLFGGS